MIIKIKQDYGSDFISRTAGEKLRKSIIQSKEIVTIDFENQIVASVSFLDEAFAKLILEGWGKEEIIKTIKFKNIHKKDMELIDKLIQDHINESK